VSLADRVDELLPQTQCTKCGYDGCRPYAEAIARGEAKINQCPPGGAQGIAKLAALIGRPVVPLDRAHGEEKPLAAALIDEQWCIGCTLCIQACPVDAIVGAPKRMHAVLLEQCTGCELCVAPCPVDCIAMIEREELHRRAPNISLEGPRPQQSRARYLARQARHEHETQALQDVRAVKADAKPRALQNAPLDADAPRRRTAIEAALARARARRA
jgi:electron transport complex protein RnfB